MNRWRGCHTHTTNCCFPGASFSPAATWWPRCHPAGAQRGAARPWCSGTTNCFQGALQRATGVPGTSWPQLSLVGSRWMTATGEPQVSPRAAGAVRGSPCLALHPCCHWSQSCFGFQIRQLCLSPHISKH